MMRENPIKRMLQWWHHVLVVPHARGILDYPPEKTLLAGNAGGTGL